MTLTIDLQPDIERELMARAQAKGVSLADFAQEVLAREALPVGPHENHPAQLPPFETGYGMLAKYGPAPSSEEIDANRRDMFRNFPQEF
jgi:hypothetical protein